MCNKLRPTFWCDSLEVFSLSFSSAGKDQFLTGINFFKTTYTVLANHQEVAGGKNCCLLLLEAVNFTG